MALVAPFTPIRRSVLQVAFPVNVLDELMPTMDDIPKPFHRDTKESLKYRKLQAEWFFRGIKDPKVLVTKEGVDRTAALSHLQSIQGSFEPSYEHKESAVSWLMSLWFDLDESKL